MFCPREQIVVENNFQITVELRLVFLKIGEIDTLKEQFQAEAFIQARWSEPSLKGTVSHSEENDIRHRQKGFLLV